MKCHSKHARLSVRLFFAFSDFSDSHCFSFLHPHQPPSVHRRFALGAVAGKDLEAADMAEAKELARKKALAKKRAAGDFSPLDDGEEESEDSDLAVEMLLMGGGEEVRWCRHHTSRFGDPLTPVPSSAGGEGGKDVGQEAEEEEEETQAQDGAAEEGLRESAMEAVVACRHLQGAGAAPQQGPQVQVQRQPPRAGEPEFRSTCVHGADAVIP